jgi:hypothetical protein
MPYQLCSENKTFEFFDFLFFKKKDNLVEIHFGHLFLSIFEKSRVVLFWGFILEKDPSIKILIFVH